MTVEAYRALATQIDNLSPGYHGGWGPAQRTVKSAIGLGMLLMDGIGDTLRVSLAADPVEEVKVGFDILKSLRLRTRGYKLRRLPKLLAAEL